MDVDYLRSTWSVTKNGTVHYLEDEMVNSLLIANSPWTVGIIIVVYLAFTTKIGPELMKKHKPMNIKGIMIAYNAAQVVYNIWLVSLFVRQGGYSYLVRHACHPPQVHLNPRRLEFIAGSYYYFISKVADLIDTVFLVLKKKNSHISVLHLFHHTTMVISVWVSLKYIRGEPGIALGILNSVVHIIMYTYYFLACMGPTVQKYLWWKKYLTQIQIGQFLIGLVFIVMLIGHKCDIHPYYNFMWSFNIVGFLILFLNFYYQAYRKKKTVKTE